MSRWIRIRDGRGRDARVRMASARRAPRPQMQAADDRPVESVRLIKTPIPKMYDALRARCSPSAHRVQTDPTSSTSVKPGLLAPRGRHPFHLGEPVDDDADPGNEIQMLSKTGSTIELSDGGGSVNDAVDDADNNMILTNDFYGTNQAGGILLTDADHTTIASNSIHHHGMEGIRITQTARSNDILNNMIWSNDIDGISGNVVRAIIKDDINQRLWLATTRGLNMINLKTFDPNNPKFLVFQA